MDILVFSDSHGHGERIEEVLRRPAVSPTAVFFLGDGLRDLAWIDLGGVPLYRVSGNCDLFSADRVEDEILVELCGIKIFAAHGHRYSVKSGHETFVARAAELGADVALFGHTHIPMTRTYRVGETFGGVQIKKELHVMNPGSIGAADASFGNVSIHKGSILTSYRQL